MDAAYLIYTNEWYLPWLTIVDISYQNHYRDVKFSTLVVDIEKFDNINLTIVNKEFNHIKLWIIILILLFKKLK